MHKNEDQGNHNALKTEFKEMSSLIWSIYMLLEIVFIFIFLFNIILGRRESYKKEQQ